MSWQDFYGFQTGAFEHPSLGSTFGMDEVRDARRGGYTGMSILEYLKPGGSRGSGLGSTHGGTWVGANREGLDISADALKHLRSLERTELGMKTGYENLQSRLSGLSSPDLSGYAKTSDLSNLATKDSLGGYAKTTDLLSLPNATQFGNLRDRVTAAEGAGLSIAGRLSNVEGAQQTQSEQISQNRAEALKVRTTSAQPVQNQATPIGIQSAQSPSAQAGMISAGLAGLSRSNKKFKNKTLNV